jgi:hypothetical protein
VDAPGGRVARRAEDEDVDALASGELAQAGGRRRWGDDLPLASSCAARRRRTPARPAWELSAPCWTGWVW